MTIVEESFTDEVSDGGSIPPSSMKDKEIQRDLLVFHMKESNKEAQLHFFIVRRIKACYSTDNLITFLRKIIV